MELGSIQSPCWLSRWLTKCWLGPELRTFIPNPTIVFFDWN